MASEAPSTRALQTLMQHCPVGVMALDGAGRVLWANSALGELVGEPPERLAGLRMGAGARTELAALLSDAVHFELHHPAGGVRHLQRTRVALTDGGELAELHYFDDRSERVRLEAECQALRQELDRLRLHEPDTGLMSRRALMLVLEPQVSRSRRYSNPLAVVALQVSFAAGAAGEGARAVGQLLKDQLRWADLVGRDDDGVFVLVLPETGREAAVALTDKIARALDQDTRVAASFFGITEWNKTDNAAGLLERARAALERARQGTDAGRAAL